MLRWTQGGVISKVNVKNCSFFKMLNMKGVEIISIYMFSIFYTTLYLLQ